MKTNHLRLSLRLLCVCLIAASFIFQASAQNDPDPDSPTPILLSEKDSTRALAVSAKGFYGTMPIKYTSRSFLPGNRSRVVLFVTNVSLLDDEGANAFNVFLEDENHTQFRMKVIGIQPVSKTVYALTTVLIDELGYWGQPQPKGDVLLNVTWRGLSSNRVRLGLGSIGGGPKDDAGSVPTPEGTSPTIGKPGVSPKYIGYRWSGDRFRFLQQATFGATPELDARVRRIGLRTWLTEQFDAPYPTYPYPNVPFKPVNAPSDCDGDQTVVPDVPVTCQRDTYSQYLPQNWMMQEAFYGDAQLRHRVATALSQVWVTSGVDIQQSSHMVEWHKILSRNAFGNWRTLMKEMTLSPTMGDYLDMVRSTKTNPNENYAREILQLFNIGLFKLNMDGTIQTDTNGNIPSYDQTIVNNFTKVMTGWGFCGTPASCPNAVPGTLNFKDQMLLNSANHDITAKTLFTYPGSTATTNVAACTGCTGTALTNYANNSLDQALDNIFNHPNVPPFVSRILIQQLVTGEPSGAYVQRVANVFANNGSNVRGDLKAVIKAILLDPEARGNVKTDPKYGKLLEPILFSTNLLRSFKVQSSDGLTLSDGVIATQLGNMGQTPFRSPTVFNYFPPEYLVPGTTLNGPEFAILNTGTSVQRANFVNTMVYSRITGGSVNIPTGTSINFADMQALAVADTSGNQLLDALNNRMMGGSMSPAMKSTILTAVTAIASTAPATRTQAAIYLIATSSQYQVQR
jgi:uncharacterized protein (DUF1800 family)